jgi:hypothetical protein
MDTTSLIIWLMGVVLIGIGLPLFYVARYLSASEDKETKSMRSESYCHNLDGSRSDDLSRGSHRAIYC